MYNYISYTPHSIGYVVLDSTIAEQAVNEVFLETIQGDYLHASNKTVGNGSNRCVHSINFDQSFALCRRSQFGGTE
jgi:hypothetical protein